MTPALLLLGSALAQDVQGFAEIRGAAFVGVEGDAFQLVERVRPTFDAALGERWALSTTVEAALVQGRRTQDEVQRTLEDSDFGPLLELSQCTWPTEANEALAISAASDVFSVDRLYLDTYQPGFDLRVGRQALQWGSAQFLNPTDPFPEVLLTEPWKPRSGVNAARLTAPIAGRHQVQAVVGTDDLFQRVRLAGRGTVNALGVDVSLVESYRQESAEILSGIDVRGTLGVGFWVEAALHARGVTDPDVDDEVYEELVAGVDYSFPVLDTLVVGAQYYRSGAPFDPLATALPTEAIEAPACNSELGDLFSEGSEAFAPLLPRGHYGLLSTMLVASPEVSVTAAWLQSFEDGTALVLPTVSTQPIGALEIAASAQIPLRTWGDGGAFSPADDDLRIEGTVFEGLPPLSADFSGLVPAASLFLWTRVGF